MSLLNQVRKNKLVFIVITLVYFAYVGVFIKPSSFKQFSFVDDGQVLFQNSAFFRKCIYHFDCSKFIDQTFEFGTNRIRPSYWLINNFLQEAFRYRPQLHHAFRIYVVGYFVVILLARILLNLNVSKLMIIIGVFLFASNFSFTENIIRLGTNEPYQVLFLALFSLYYLKNREIRTRSNMIFLIVFLVWTIFVKENNIAVLPAVFLVDYFSLKKNTKKASLLVGIPFTLFFIGLILSKYTQSSISLNIPIYTSNYTVNALAILKNAVANISLLLNSMSPFLKLTLLLSPLLIINKEARKLLRNERFYYWLIFSVTFTALLFPWKYVLERYQLVSIFGLTIISIFLIDVALRIAKEKIFIRLKPIPQYKLIFNVLTFWIIMNIFFRGFSLNLAKTINYQNWFAGFTSFEAEQVKEIAKYDQETVYINGVNNINNWEFLYEIPIHLKFLYNIESNAELLTHSLDEGDYLFSRSSLDPVIEIDKLSELGYEIINSKSYEIDRIDPLQFRERFITRPLETVLNPPLEDVGHEYYWEVRKLTKG